VFGKLAGTEPQGIGVGYGSLPDCLLPGALGDYCSLHVIEDGNQLLEFCEGKSNFDTDICVGYITGSADHFTYTKALLKFAKQGGEGGTCLPERATPQQLTAVFVKYAKNHPEDRHLPARYMIAMAWAEAFPCK